jgi:hypothetical protein
MTDLKRELGTSTRHLAKWKRMAKYAKTLVQREMYLERVNFWQDIQERLASMMDKKKK